MEHTFSDGSRVKSYSEVGDRFGSGLFWIGNKFFKFGLPGLLLAVVVVGTYLSHIVQITALPKFFIGNTLIPDIARPVIHAPISSSILNAKGVNVVGIAPHQNHYFSSVYSIDSIGSLKKRLFVREVKFIPLYQKGAVMTFLTPQ